MPQAVEAEMNPQWPLMQLVAIACQALDEPEGSRFNSALCRA
jgi:hypothetical protein